jgi:hypothetical protein
MAEGKIPTSLAGNETRPSTTQFSILLTKPKWLILKHYSIQSNLFQDTVLKEDTTCGSIYLQKKRERERNKESIRERKKPGKGETNKIGKFARKSWKCLKKEERKENLKESTKDPGSVQEID